MEYISTRGKAPILDFGDVLFTSLARDGGLYVPQTWPKFSNIQIRDFVGLQYEDIAFKVIQPFVGSLFSHQELQRIIKDAYFTFESETRCPVSKIRDNFYQMELYHGPTFAFKDVAMQLVARMFDQTLQKSDRKITMIAATSGDTGAAAVEAFKGLESVNLFILYPEGRISDVQQRQITYTNQKNIHAFSVKGNFDDCQSIVKMLFSDLTFRDKANLSGVNSINWARILAQTVYYFSAYAQLDLSGQGVKFSVPTGNFGNIFAGSVAKRMGLPIKKLIMATNRNDILYRTIEMGAYKKELVSPTISPSMDIQVSSNFERLLFELYDRKSETVSELMNCFSKTGACRLSHSALAAFRRDFEGGRCTEAETLATIREVFNLSGNLICPHTAVGLNVAQKSYKNDGLPVITLATAHPAKFPDAVKLATGVLPEVPRKLAKTLNHVQRFTSVENSVTSVKNLIEERI